MRITALRSLFLILTAALLAFSTKASTMTPDEEKRVVSISTIRDGISV